MTRILLNKTVRSALCLCLFLFTASISSEEKCKVYLYGKELYYSYKIYKKLTIPDGVCSAKGKVICTDSYFGASPDGVKGVILSRFLVTACDSVSPSISVDAKGNVTITRHGDKCRGEAKSTIRQYCTVDFDQETISYPLIKKTKHEDKDKVVISI